MQLVRTGILAWLGVSLALAATPSLAQTPKGQISEKTLLILMDYAWALMPEEFTTESGKVIRINKNKFEEIRLPLDDAREVVRVGRLSGQAQLCEMPEAQTANYDALMAREVARRKWTDQQLVFINKLHLFTVMTMTGQVKAAEGDAPKAAAKEAPPLKTANCSEADRKRIDDEVLANVNAAPALPAAKAGPAEKKK
jgi:hypothetical protein